MYYFPEQPPYLLLPIGFFIALTSGLALSGTIKLVVQKWQISDEQNPQNVSSWRALIVPFLGIAVGSCLFLCSGLEIFGFPSFLALTVGLPISLLTCLLVWYQLGSMLDFVKTRGMKSLDLDSFS
ncbi:hypothetical protein [Fortiea contorta]|uniref:hypothetical protein n=1 Tax=Fortiea contorta TaxID=1892405 RepID=UPI00034BD429|nr:hypothetical protein [Fortiea contorta]